LRCGLLSRTGCFIQGFELRRRGRLAAHQYRTDLDAVFAPGERPALRPLCARLDPDIDVFVPVRRRTSVVDEVPPALQVCVAQELVWIQRRGFKYGGGLEQLGAAVDEKQAVEGIAVARRLRIQKS